VKEYKNGCKNITMGISGMRIVNIERYDLLFLSIKKERELKNAKEYIAGKKMQSIFAHSEIKSMKP